MKKRRFVPFNMFIALVMAVGMLIGSSPATSATGPVAGCPQATHVTFKGPWDPDGNWYFPKLDKPRLRLAIVHPWWNLDAPSVINDRQNPGQPPWDQTQVKVKVTAKARVRFVGVGGEAWIYKNVSACRHNLKYEFLDDPQPKVYLSDLKDLGLAWVYWVN